MPVFSSSSVRRQPTPAQESDDWSNAVGTWKVGKRDDFNGVPRPRSVQSGDTKLVSNFDPVSGRHHIGHFSVGRLGWKNQRKGEAPTWLQHQRAISVPRQSGETIASMSQHFATKTSSLCFFCDAVPKEDRTTLGTPDSKTTSPPHPALRYAEKLKRLAPQQNLPRRLTRMQNQTADNPAHQQPGYTTDRIRDMLQKMLADNLMIAHSQLKLMLSSKSHPGVSQFEFNRMLFETHWSCNDEHMIALMRTYACDAGIDAELVVMDMQECIQRPGFSASRFPAVMQIVISSLMHKLQALEARFLKSDEEARENNKSVGTRLRTEGPSGHVDLQVFSEHLNKCGFEVQGVMNHLQNLYISREGVWQGYINYAAFLSDFSDVSRPYLQAAADKSISVLDEFAQFQPCRTSSFETKRPKVSAGSRKPVEYFGSYGAERDTIDRWTRPSTASNSIRPHSSSRPGTSLSAQRSILKTPVLDRLESSDAVQPSILQSTRKEEKLRKHLEMVLHNIDNVLRCFQDADMKKNKTVSHSTAEDILRPMSRGMSIEELSWLTGRFSDNGRFRYEEFLDWVLPLGDEARRQRPPQLSGPVPTSLNYSVAMRGSIVTGLPEEGVKAFRPASSKHQLRMPPPTRRIPTPTEWASTFTSIQRRPATPA